MPEIHPTTGSRAVFLSYAHEDTAAARLAPRITIPIPTLMLNGRYDFHYPLETSQGPMFRLLGAPPEHKRHVLFDTGHAFSADQISKEVLAWLDRYLRPVK